MASKKNAQNKALKKQTAARKSGGMTTVVPAAGLVVPVLLFLVIQLVTTLVVAFMAGEGWIPDEQMGGIATAASALINLIALAVIDRKMGLGTLTRESVLGRLDCAPPARGRSRQRSEVRMSAAAGACVICVLLAVCLNVLLNGLVLMTGIQNIDPLFKSAQASFAEGSLPVQILAYGILVPIAEEWLFRGFVYRFFEDRFHGNEGFHALAIVLTSLTFAVYHGNLTQGIYVFFLGIFLCLAVDRGGLLCAVIIHLGVNLTSLIGNQIPSYRDILTHPAAHWPYILAAAVIGEGLFLLLGRVTEP